MKNPFIVVPKPLGFTEPNLRVDEATVRPAAGSFAEPGAFEEWPALGVLNPQDTGIVSGLRLNKRLSPYLRDNGSGYVLPALVDGPSGVVGYAPPVSGAIASVVVTGGGSGGTPGNYRKNLTGGGGEGALVVYTVAAGGNISLVSMLERGRRYTGTPVLDTSESGVVGATFTFRRFKTIGSIPVTTPGTAGTRMPTVSVTITGITDGTVTTQPRAIAIANGSGGIGRIEFEDSGEFSEMAGFTVAMSGGNVTGAALGTPVTKYNALRGIVLTNPGGGHAAISDIPLTITPAAGDTGSGAVGGMYTGRDWTRGDAFITTAAVTPAGDAYDMNGITLPFLDDREFTLLAAIKYETLIQTLGGSWVGAPANGAAWGGTYLTNSPAGTWTLRDPAMSVTSVALTLPAGLVAGDWTVLVWGFAPVAGASLSGVQHGDLYARVGNAAPATYRGAASLPNLPRLHSIGPAYG